MVRRGEKLVHYTDETQGFSQTYQVCQNSAALCMQCMQSPLSLNTIWKVNQDCFDFYNTLEQQER